MPQPVFDKLSGAALKVVQSEEFDTFAKTNVYVADPMGPEDAKKDIQEFSAIYADLLKFIEKK